MATFDIVAKPGKAKGTQIAGVAQGASTAEQIVGKNCIFEIIATQPIKIAFGNTGMGAADATDFLIPANTVKRFELGMDFTAFRVFNAGTGSADVHYLILSRF